MTVIFLLPFFSHSPREKKFLEGSTHLPILSETSKKSILPYLPRSKYSILGEFPFNYCKRTFKLPPHQKNDPIHNLITLSTAITGGANAIDHLTSYPTSTKRIPNLEKNNEKRKKWLNPY